MSKKFGFLAVTVDNNGQQWLTDTCDHRDMMMLQEPKSIGDKMDVQVPVVLKGKPGFSQFTVARLVATEVVLVRLNTTNNQEYCRTILVWRVHSQMTEVV